MPLVQRDYTIAQVARQSGVSYNTVSRRIKDAIIPANRFGPKCTRIDRATVLRLKQHGLNGLPEAKSLGY